MTVGEYKCMRVKEAEGEIITYYKIQSTGEYAIKRSYLNEAGDQCVDDNYILDENMIPQFDLFRLFGILMGFDETEPSDSSYGIGNTDVMEDAKELTEEEFFEAISKDKEAILKIIRETKNPYRK